MARPRRLPAEPFPEPRADVPVPVQEDGEYGPLVAIPGGEAHVQTFKAMVNDRERLLIRVTNPRDLGAVEYLASNFARSQPALYDAIKSQFPEIG